MKLIFQRPYKSIKSLPIIELPDFVIITGVNGSGKTHLLQAISNSCVQIEDIIANSYPSPIRLYNWANLTPHDSSAISPSQLTQEMSSFWYELSLAIQSLRSHILNILGSSNLSRLIEIDFRKLVQMKEEDFIATGIEPQEARSTFQAIQNVISSSETDITALIRRNLGEIDNRILEIFRNEVYGCQLIHKLQEAAKIPIVAFEEDDFFKYSSMSWMPVDMFQQSFERLFMEYQRIRQDNQFREFKNWKGENVSFLSEEEFQEQYGEPPWDIVNDILRAANLDFRINLPVKYRDQPYKPILIAQGSGDQVEFSELSSGERILISFALCLYYTQDQRQLVEYPKVVLFDEIDASLHPSMTQSLLRTIQEVLIDRKGIKVILATHSPSTVALAPEEALFVMNKNEQRRLQKTTKDKALAILTAGVPTLSIDYENRRQVFVESKYDVEFYEQIYKKIRDKLTPEISLNFISSGLVDKKEGEGNCDKVKEVVNKLDSYGNRTVYGIIDWDLKNNGNERVKVLGKNKRYSIENYILDPIFVAAFLLREKWIERSTINLKENETYIDLEKFDQTRLQPIVDFIVGKVRNCSPPPTEGDTIECEYIGGQKAKIPAWFLYIKGHQLEDTLKQLFPQLNRYQQEAELKREILLKVVDDMPQLLSVDFMSLFSEIQNVNV
jgi:ABC-type cobalamin/Fe3+-siderophores transport system ATPase subunit